jgi:hypothetical protein
MPNYIKNKLTFEKRSDIDKILEFTKTEYGEFDFNKLIPMPKELDNELWEEIYN